MKGEFENQEEILDSTDGLFVFQYKASGSDAWKDLPGFVMNIGEAYAYTKGAFGAGGKYRRVNLYPEWTM